MSKKAYKLHEFTAHGANVNCLKIGRKSSGVLVTGGDDKRVNMWAIGKSSAILSLSGHQSAVECVTFDSAEEVVVAGAAGGTLKLWDLEEAKVVRTLSGHRSNCTAVDFHPYGEITASGSLDTNLKIWDIRRKNCIHTYKGHTRGIKHVRFSPDGRWVVSGGDDGVVKLWDLTAGKLMNDFKLHEGAITAIDFHPNEFLLATGSADRTVKFWDLETFECIGSTPTEATPPRAITFTPDGSTLLSATQDFMKVWRWEPVRDMDAVPVAWTKVSDLSLHDGRLLGCSFHQTFVGVWVVDLASVAPFSAEPRSSAVGIGGGGAKADQALPEDAPPRTPERSAARPSPTAGERRQRTPLLAGQSPSAASRPAVVARTPARPAGGTPGGAGGSASKEMVSVGTDIGSSLRDGALSSEELAALARQARAQEARLGPVDGGLAAGGSGLRDRLEERRAAARPKTGPASTGGAFPGFMGAARGGGAGEFGGGGVGGTKKGLDIEQFLPQSNFDAAGRGGGAGARDEDVIEDLTAKTSTMSQIMTARLANLQVARSFHSRGDVKGAIEAMARMGDQSVAVDVLGQLNDAPSNYTLETAAVVTGLVENMLISDHDRYKLTGMATAAILTKSFGTLINTTREASPSTFGVDLSMEQRMERCNAAYQGLMSCRDRIRATVLSNPAPEVEKKGMATLELIDGVFGRL